MESDSGDFGGTYRSSLRPATQLINEVISISRDYQARLGRDLGVNATDLAVIGLVMLAGPQSPSELSRGLGLSAAAMTTVVDRLVKLGHVTRSQHPTDRRGVLVTATPASVQRALDQVLPVAIAVDGVLDEFDADEQDAITRYLERVAAVHRKHLPD